MFFSEVREGSWVETGLKEGSCPNLAVVPQVGGKNVVMGSIKGCILWGSPQEGSKTSDGDN